MDELSLPHKGQHLPQQQYDVRRNFSHRPYVKCQKLSKATPRQVIYPERVFVPSSIPSDVAKTIKELGAYLYNNSLLTKSERWIKISTADQRTLEGRLVCFNKNTRPDRITIDEQKHQKPVNVRIAEITSIQNISTPQPDDR